MMSRTHLTVGVGSALAIMLPTEAKFCCTAVIGGLLGGIITDNDIFDNDYTGDAILGQVIEFGATAVILFTDKILNIGLCNELFSRSIINLFFCLFIFIGLYVFGFFKNTENLLIHFWQ